MILRGLEPRESVGSGAQASSLTALAEVRKSCRIGAGGFIVKVLEIPNPVSRVKVGKLSLGRPELSNYSQNAPTETDRFPDISSFF